MSGLTAGEIFAGFGVMQLSRTANAMEKLTSVTSMMELNQRESNILLNQNLEIDRKRNRILEQSNIIQEGRYQSDLERNELLRSQVDNDKDRFDFEIRGKKLEELRLENQQLEQQRTNYLRDVIFATRGDIEDTIQSADHIIQKYFQLLYLQDLIEGLNISTRITDDFADKEYINEILKKLNQVTNKHKNDLSQEENEDIDTIFKILRVDEESNIAEAQKLLKEEKKNEQNLRRDIKTYEEATIVFQLPKQIADLEKEIKQHKEKDPDNL